MSVDRTSESLHVEPALAVLKPKRTFGQSIIFFITHKPLGAFGAGVAIVLVIVALAAPVIRTHDPYESSVAMQFAKPGAGEVAWRRPPGTGHVQQARLRRENLPLRGILSSLIGSTIGMVAGVASVHFGGKVDLVVQRIIDAMMAFPGLILILAIMAALGASLNNVVLALSIAYIPSTARILRSQALAIKEMDYVLAASAVGAGHWRIIMRHIIPNCFALYIVMVTLHLGGAIISEAGLSFLGVGTPPQRAVMGAAVLNGAAANVTVAWWVAIFPGVAIFIVVFAWNVLGDALRDVLDPRLRGTGSA